MKLHLSSLFLFILIISACQPEGRTYVKYKTLSPDLEWIKKDVRIFEIPVENTSKRHDLKLAFRYANGYMYDVLKVKVSIISPSGLQNEKDYTLQIRDESGQYIGDPGYDIWDLEQTIESEFVFEEQGIYTLKIEHSMPKDPLHFGMEIGVVIDDT